MPDLAAIQALIEPLFPGLMGVRVTEVAGDRGCGRYVGGQPGRIVHQVHDPRVAEPSAQFDRWLAKASGEMPAERAMQLAHWA